ncbi:cob(I)yrinic acid a,c-diamide adenosyltransferase [Candidatus Enterococcus murrayae]|uniref:Corrinoid adenosyltransferase n=1 Tax=Candidatus Enterococcus murrayae TaxID=2815321 RepID=A0ABS3HQ88_9ENTE|nr:cob(I)yrinic acid a,c-diamide adenosyltransferase [Enterococcus sp. MJM16]MBO0454773.1 cob(I)yrinic acid a,c-diamide adenosyltransferase [Enterococcus sp. MJM16]
MAIYTKTGDKGTTSLFDGTRVKKSDLRVDTYGTFDECCAQVSVAQKLAEDPETIQHLEWVQQKLFRLNAEIATEKDLLKLEAKSTLISAGDIQQMEEWIDQYTKRLPELHSFILPGQTLSAAQLHVARAICRRGERLLTDLSDSAEIREDVRKFVNRLSDCLYIFARMEDHRGDEKKLVDEILRRYLERSRPQIHESQLGRHHEIFQACEEAAEKIAVPVSMALVDETGSLVSFYRMAGALLVSEALAQKKAYTAVAMKTHTHELKELVQPAGDLYQLETLTDGQIVTFGGGFVIKESSGKVLGGLGISGGAVEEDMAIAQKGLEKLKEI